MHTGYSHMGISFLKRGKYTVLMSISKVKGMRSYLCAFLFVHFALIMCLAESRFNWKLPLQKVSSILQCRHMKYSSLLSLTLLSPTPVWSDVPQIASTSFVTAVTGTITPDPEVARAFSKAKQLEYSNNFDDAQSIYEEIVNISPDFIYGWSNLGNVLVAQGDLQNALLCYKKAVSLQPPREALPTILLNRAVVEMNLGDNKQALADLNIAQKFGGDKKDVLINKAVALSRTNQFQEGASLFDQVIDSSDKYPLPWWLRYSISLLEVGRSTESIAITKRVLNRFPDEPECNAFAAALFSKLGVQKDANDYWSKLNTEDQAKYSDTVFLREKLFWGLKSIEGIQLLTKGI